MADWAGCNSAPPEDALETYLSSLYIDAAISSLRSRGSTDIASDTDSIAPLIIRDDISIYSLQGDIYPPPRHPGRSANSGPRNLASKRYRALTEVKCTGHSLMPGPQAPRVIITDETIVPVCVKLENEESTKAQRRRSIASRLREQALGRGRSANFKVTQMPRGEYLKYFARDSAGNYLGTEPYRAWTAEELEDAYGRYRTLPVAAPQSAVKTMRVHERAVHGAEGRGDGTVEKITEYFTMKLRERRDSDIAGPEYSPGSSHSSGSESEWI